MEKRVNLVPWYERRRKIFELIVLIQEKKIKTRRY